MTSRSTEEQVPPRLIAAKPAAARLGLSYTTLRERVFDGEIPVVKIGTRWFFELTDLDQFVTRHKTTL